MPHSCLFGGSLGGRFGRRKVCLIGVVWFALASAACGFAPAAVLLIVTQMLQGAGAALVTPGSLAILEASFVPADRARAIGAWSGLSGCCHRCRAADRRLSDLGHVLVVGLAAPASAAPIQHYLCQPTVGGAV